MAAVAGAAAAAAAAAATAVAVVPPMALSSSSSSVRPPPGPVQGAADAEGDFEVRGEETTEGASGRNRGEGKDAKKRKKGTRREFDWSKATFGHFVIKIAYVGTKYFGLAWQDPSACPNCPTVESKLFEALIKTCLIRDRTSCSYSRCGRTDKGVHAAGNYIALQLREKPRKEGASGDDDYDYAAMLNGVLSSDIRMLACCRAPPGFDARFSCKYRAYQYYFPLCGENLDRMREAAQSFVGAHDFRNFCKMDIEAVTNYRREVLSVSVREKPGGVGEFSVTGLAFLWHQVRNMVAVLLLVGAGHEEPGIVRELLDIEKHPRKPIFEPADESGLVLRDCGFLDIPFAPGVPAPLAGETSAQSDFSASASAAETLQQMWAQSRRVAAVQECLAAASGGGAFASEFRPREKHTPLLRRGVGPSFEEKVKAFEVKKRRKNDAGTSAEPIEGDGDGDE